MKKSASFSSLPPIDQSPFSGSPVTPSSLPIGQSTGAMKKSVSLLDLSTADSTIYSSSIESLLSSVRPSVETKMTARSSPSSTHDDDEIKRLEVPLPSVIALRGTYHTARSLPQESIAPMSPELSNLPVDAIVEILSHLPPSDLRRISATCCSMRTTVCGPEGDCLWTHLMRKRWPALLRTGQNASRRVIFKDGSGIATTGLTVGVANVAAEKKDQQKNLSVLLGLSSPRGPSRVNTQIYTPLSQGNQSSIEFRSFDFVPSSPPPHCPAQKLPIIDQHIPVDEHEGHRREGGSWRAQRLLNESGPLPAVQFRGQVGSGECSILVGSPLARPLRRHDDRRSDSVNNSLIDRFGLRFKSTATRAIKVLRQGAHGAVCHGQQDWDSVRKPKRPFVAPFVVSSNKKDAEDDGSATLVVDLTPRLLSYFEVSILLQEEERKRSLYDEPTNVGMEHGSHPSRTSECIAIGVSMRCILPNLSMPGWDEHSYGYHSDDGGIFHASGTKERSFGPPYGPGDTVGCGVNYMNGGIFFTLNGEFLGYAWTGLGAIRGGMKRKDAGGSEELYPTVGVDSACPLACNFGERAFAFDLGAFIRGSSHMDAVKQALVGLVN